MGAMGMIACMAAVVMMMSQSQKKADQSKKIGDHIKKDHGQQQQGEIIKEDAEKI